MKSLSVKSWFVLLLLLPVLGCSKPESRLIGKWMNEKTANIMEFNENKTGVIYQRTNPNLPPNIPFRWTMLKKNQFKVEVGMPGAPPASEAIGSLGEKDTLILENDVFKRIKQ